MVARTRSTTKKPGRNTRRQCISETQTLNGAEVTMEHKREYGSMAVLVMVRVHKSDHECRFELSRVRR